MYYRRFPVFFLLSLSLNHRPSDRIRGRYFSSAIHLWSCITAVLFLILSSYPIYSHYHCWMHLHLFLRSTLQFGFICFHVLLIMISSTMLSSFFPFVDDSGTGISVDTSATNSWPWFFPPFWFLPPPRASVFSKRKFETFDGKFFHFGSAHCNWWFTFPALNLFSPSDFLILVWLGLALGAC